MNNHAYSAFPGEGEILLTEGIAVKILDIQNDVKIQNKHECMKDFDGRSIIIIHMLHRSPRSRAYSGYISQKGSLEDCKDYIEYRDRKLKKNKDYFS